MFLSGDVSISQCLQDLCRTEGLSQSRGLTLLVRCSGLIEVESSGKSSLLD